MITVQFTYAMYLQFVGFRVNIWLCSEDIISKYNKAYRSDEIRNKHLKELEEEESVDGDTVAATPQTIQNNSAVSVDYTLQRRSGRRRRVGSKTPRARAASLQSTDILSFPALQFQSPGVLQPTGNEWDGSIPPLLGDIMISPEYIRRQCVKDKQMDDVWTQVYV